MAFSLMERVSLERNRGWGEKSPCSLCCLLAISARWSSFIVEIAITTNARSSGTAVAGRTSRHSRVTCNCSVSGVNKRSCSWISWIWILHKENKKLEWRKKITLFFYSYEMNTLRNNFAKIAYSLLILSHDLRTKSLISISGLHCGSFQRSKVVVHSSRLG